MIVAQTGKPPIGFPSCRPVSESLIETVTVRDGIGSMVSTFLSFRVPAKGHRDTSASLTGSRIIRGIVAPGTLTRAVDLRRQIESDRSQPGRLQARAVSK